MSAECITGGRSGLYFDLSSKLFEKISPAVAGRFLMCVYQIPSRNSLCPTAENFSFPAYALPIVDYVQIVYAKKRPWQIGSGGFNFCTN